MSKKKPEIPLPCLGPGVTLVDTHCHLDFPDYGGSPGQVIKEAAQAGVEQIVSVGIDLESSRKAVALAETQQGLFATVGVHPHHVESLDEQVYNELQQLAGHPRVVAVGEIGLDYVKQYAPVALQQEHCRLQLRLARQLDLPVIIHDREAHADMLRLLAEEGPFPAGGVMHCFSGDGDFARQVLELGFYISIPGVVTFPNAEALRDAVREVPLGSLVLETDGPFLAPVPKRGKRNMPHYILYTAQKVAQVKGVSIDEVAKATTDNARALFKLTND